MHRLNDYKSLSVSRTKFLWGDHPSHSDKPEADTDELETETQNSEPRKINKDQEEMLWYRTDQ